MTAIIDIGALPAKQVTKTLIRNYIEKGWTGQVHVADPAIVGGFGRTRLHSLPDGEYLVTNHPARSWFGKLTKRGQKLELK